MENKYEVKRSITAPKGVDIAVAITETVKEAVDFIRQRIKEDGAHPIQYHLIFTEVETSTDAFSFELVAEKVKGAGTH